MSDNSKNGSIILDSIVENYPDEEILKADGIILNGPRSDYSLSNSKTLPLK